MSKNILKILKEALLLKESEEDSNKVFFTGSEVLIDMLEKYKEELPFIATIRKIDRYYTLS